MVAALLAVTTLGLSASRGPLRWADADRSVVSSPPAVLTDVSWLLAENRQPAGVLTRIGARTVVSERDQLGPFTVGLKWQAVASGWTLSFDDGRRRLLLSAPKGSVADSAVHLSGGVVGTNSDGTTWSAEQLRWRFGDERLALRGAAQDPPSPSRVESSNWTQRDLWPETLVEGAGQSSGSETSWR